MSEDGAGGQDSTINNTNVSFANPNLYGRNHEERHENLVEWINETSTGDDGFTALHFASFHGNM